MLIEYIGDKYRTLVPKSCIRGLTVPLETLRIAAAAAPVVSDLPGSDTDDR